jgi:hypothetical protein
VTHPAVIPAMNCASMSPLVAVAAELDAARTVRSCRGAPGVRAAQRFSMPSPAIPRPWDSLQQDKGMAGR